MTRHTCRACDGKRTYDVHTYKMHGGVRCGSAVTLTYPCEACGGKGFVTCIACEDTGWMPETGPDGEYDGDRPCIHCDRGRFVDEQAADGHDAYAKRLERENLDRAIAMYDAAITDNIAVGNEPF